MPMSPQPSFASGHDTWVKLFNIANKIIPMFFVKKLEMDGII